MARAAELIDALDELLARPEQHLEAAALVRGLHEHDLEHLLDRLARGVAEVLAEAGDARGDALAHLLAHLDLDGGLVHQARARHLPALRLRLLGRQAREQVGADLRDALVGALGPHQPLRLAHLDVHEAREPRADLGQEADGVFARADVLEVLVEHLLGAALELRDR